MDITHLVVNGCSWTYCEGLAHPDTQGWPALLAKKLGVEFVNLAVPGCGNDSIHRRTYEYVIENLPSGSKPLFIIAWSQYWRRESWYNELHGIKDFNDYSLITIPPSGPRSNTERALLDNWNEIDFYRKTYLYKISLINLFENNNIPYLMSDYADNHDTQVIKTIQDRFPNLVDMCLNNSKHLSPFYKITHDYPKTKCGHDGPEAQQVLSSYIKTELDNQYGSFNIVPGSFLTLNNFKISNTGDSIADRRLRYRP